MIKLSDLSFRYGKKENLFHSLNLELPEGNIYGLLGKNGAGKTTLLKLISGLNFPKGGDAEVFGHTPKERNPDFLADLYLVPEELYVPNMKINSFINLYAPFYPKFDNDQFLGHLNEFEIPLNSNLTELSYGQKKKVLLSFGLATNCRLLILDEPTNGLDIPSKSQFRSLLARNTRDDQIVIISTHQVRDMANLIDPIVILENGEIIFQQALEEITRQLHFELVSGMNEPEDVLYAERVPGGWLTVSKNETGQESEMDVEVLFNAVVTKRHLINELF